jgi:hypothetical protein
VATASEAIERIAEATGIMQATVFRAARFLRERDTSLWPQGSQGRGQEAHVEPHHLVNVVLALAAADPLTTAPDVVAQLRELSPRPDGIPVTSRDDSGNETTVHAYRSTPFLPGATLGEALDRLVAASDMPEVLMINFRISARLTHIVLSTVTQNNGKWDDVYCFYMPTNDPTTAEGGKTVMWWRQLTFDIGLIKVLAELYADTLDHRAKLAAKTKTKRQPSTTKAGARV